MKHLFCVAIVFPLFIGCSAEVNTSLPVAEILPDGTSVLILKGHTDAVLDVTFSPDGTKIVSASADITARIWDAETGKKLKILRGHLNLEGRERALMNDKKSVVSVATFSPGGRTIATGGTDGTVRIWDTESGKELRKIEGRGDPRPPFVPPGHNFPAFTSVSFSPDGGMILTVNSDGYIKLWDVASGKEIQEVWRGARAPASFSSDGKKIIAKMGLGVNVWDTETNVLVKDSWTERDIEWKRPLLMLEIDRGSFTSAVFSPDGEKIIAVSRDHLRNDRVRPPNFTNINGSLQVWGTDFQSDCELPKVKERAETFVRRDLLLDEKLLLLNLEGCGGMDVAISPVGKKIASAGFDGIVRIVNAESGVELKKLKGHTGSISSVAFSPDGKKIVTGGEDKTVRIWTLE